MEGFSFVISMVLRRLPMLILVLVGVIVAILRWKRHPKVSLLTIIGLLLYLVERSIFIPLSYWLPRYLYARQFATSSFQIVTTLVYLVDDIFYAVVIILLVAAAFSQRTPQLTTVDKNI